MTQGGVCVCVFMLQQYEAQLCDPPTLSKTSSEVEDNRLKAETHSCSEDVRVRSECSRYGHGRLQTIYSPLIRCS